MYLSAFRKYGVGPGNWGTAPWWGHMADSADILLDEVDDTLNSWKEAHDVINFGANIHEGRWPEEGVETPYQAIIGLDGFWHDTKNVLVVPLHQFQGEIIHRDGRRERLEFKKPE